MIEKEVASMATYEVDRSDSGRLPTWITIGAMKSATTSLHRYLAEHPDIAVSEPKELDFFIEPRYGKLGLDWYRRQFGSAAIAAGESSVNYTKCHKYPGVAARMHRHLPDVRLIYMVRDPFDRIESHWVHAVGEGQAAWESRRRLARPRSQQPRADIALLDPALVFPRVLRSRPDPGRVLRGVLR